MDGWYREKIEQLIGKEPTPPSSPYQPAALETPAALALVLVPEPSEYVPPIGTSVVPAGVSERPTQKSSTEGDEDALIDTEGVSPRKDTSADQLPPHSLQEEIAPSLEQQQEQ
ncbi:uncharacterized protein J3R85_008096 [Psidium guajava]|nr:uncharacterized protein J3R85_008096 [Psidium guajava]